MMLTNCKNLTQAEIKKLMFEDSQRKQREFAEAERLGHVYHLFINGHAFCLGDDEDAGWEIIAKTDEDAIAIAMEEAAMLCHMLIDKVFVSDKLTRSFKLMHMGRLVYEYIPNEAISPATMEVFEDFAATYENFDYENAS